MTWSATLPLLQVFALAILALAAAIDVKKRTIPNGLVLGIMATGLAIGLIDNGPGALLISVATAVALLVALATLARRDKIGGGDAKLIAATTLLVAPSQIFALITVIALAGGVLAILYFIRALAWSYAKRRRTALGPNIGAGLGAPAHIPADGFSAGPAGEIADHDQLPYGVAIFIGTALAFWWLP